MKMRRIIYLLMILAVGIPVFLGYSRTPSRLVSAARMYEVMAKTEFKPGEGAMVGLDF